MSSLFRSVKTLKNSSAHLLCRGYGSEAVPERKVAVLGAAGGIGQPLALLMKLNPLVSNLALYDIANTPGVAADVSHINTRSEVYIDYYFSIVIFFAFRFLISLFVALLHCLRCLISLVRIRVHLLLVASFI